MHLVSLDYFLLQTHTNIQTDLVQTSDNAIEFLFEIIAAAVSLYDNCFFHLLIRLSERTPSV